MKKRGAATPTRPAPRAPDPVPPVLVALAVTLAATLIAIGVSFRMDDPDLWQHLAVGRALWQLRSIPHENLWTWPGHGEPYLLPSWLFRAVLWPFWAWGGEAGLAAWRWLATLGAFALLWAAARRGGARGLAPLVVIVWCAMIARRRSMCRPEMLCAVLLAAQMWILECRRGGDRRHTWWLVPIAGVWANAHVSYVVFFEVGLAYLADEWLRRSEGKTDPRQLARVLAVSLAACFANPFGFAGLWQPFDFVLHQQHEPIFLTVDELRPTPWYDNVRNGLGLLIALMPILALVRWRRRFDLAELIVYALFIPQALQVHRFVGTLVAAAVPFLARDAAEWFGSGGWPAWATRPGARAGLAMAGCLLVATPELLRPTTKLGFGFVPGSNPKAACDWIERHDVRGRAFNLFDGGGYLLWRFWPQRDRLPFIDIHQTAPRADRDLYAHLDDDPRAWRALDAEHRFDWVLLTRGQGPLTHRVDWVDADSTFVPAFIDDEYVIYLRRQGAMAALARSDGFRYLRGSYRSMPAFGDTVEGNPAARPAVRAELERVVRESPRCGHAHSLLANLDMLDGRWADAIRELRAARAIEPRLQGLDEREKQSSDSLAALPGRPGR
jgi:hypothetical protein